MSSISDTPDRSPPQPSLIDDPSDIDIATFSRFFFKTMAKHGHPLPLRRRRSVDDSADVTLSNSPLKGVAGFNRSRTVLDAFVSVCVHGGGQCLSLSVTFGSTVRICLAQNNEKPQPFLQQYLKTIWSQLNAISALEIRLRSETGLRDTADGMGGSPNSAESQLPDSYETATSKSLQELLEALSRNIHKFCYFKTKHRVIKYLAGFPDFFQYYRANQHMLDPVNGAKSAINALNQIYQIMMNNEKPLDAAGVPMLDWDTLAYWFHAIHRECTNYRHRLDEVFGAWDSYVNVDEILTGFNLDRALQKMRKLSSNTEDLIRFAYSPRLRSTLQKELEIVLLDPIVVPVPEPSVEEMKSIVQRTFAMTRYAADLNARGEDGKLELKKSLDQQLGRVEQTLSLAIKPICVHAEYALLIHHQREARMQRSTPEFRPPFQYIAVNKLSCFCCWSIYEEYSKATNCIFMLRGSHSKFCFPWWAATDHFESKVAVAMRKGLYSRLVGLYSEHLKEFGFSHRRLSDSTVASDDSRGNSGMFRYNADRRKGETDILKRDFAAV